MTTQLTPRAIDISVVMPVMNERENIAVLLPRLKATLKREGLGYELLVVDGNSKDGSREVAEAFGARVMAERKRGYAGALTTGVAEACGDYILTLDADLSHDPCFINRMWEARTHGDIVIASRYARGGHAYTGWMRKRLSNLLNWVMRRMLAMPIDDLSSGFRLYKRAVVQNLSLESRNFEIQEEILVKAYTNGFSVTEVPFVYFPRHSGKSHARVIRFGIDLARCAIKLRKLRRLADSNGHNESGH
ncbi:MAG TPA: glycosyltransferase [Candidatus Binataceae bacterium]|nr:glycosyltransferase [Candidatus Binataceae bacterium]